MTTTAARLAAQPTSSAELVERIQPRLRHLAGRFIHSRSSRSLDRCDLVQEASVRILESAERTFDRTKGASRTTHADNHARGAMLDAFRTERRAQRDSDAQANEIEEGGADLSFFFANPPPPDAQIERERIARAVHEAFASIDWASSGKPDPARLKSVARRYYFDGEQQSEIAADLGLHYSRISQLCTDAKRLIGQALRNHPLLREHFEGSET